MGTRAVITFKDEYQQFSVYQHWDGDPQSIMSNIDDAKAFAWPAPRFEAADFAAAYIRAVKREGGGNVYFTTGPEAHDDILYRYDVSGGGVSGVQVVAYDREGRTYPLGLPGKLLNPAGSTA